MLELQKTRKWWQHTKIVNLWCVCLYVCLYMYVCVDVFQCVHVLERVCVCVCACACAHSALHIIVCMLLSLYFDSLFKLSLVLSFPVTDTYCLLKRYHDCLKKIMIVDKKKILCLKTIIAQELSSISLLYRLQMHSDLTVKFLACIAILIYFNNSAFAFSSTQNKRLKAEFSELQSTSGTDKTDLQNVTVSFFTQLL